MLYAHTTKIERFVYPALFLIAILLIWQFAVRISNIPSYVLPAPSDVYASLITGRSVVFSNLSTTAIEAALGFVLGSMFGFGVGVLISESDVAAHLILPYLVGSNAVPVVAIAPLVILWFGHGLLSKIVVAAFLCFFPLCLNTYKGLSETPALLRELFLVYGGTRMQLLLKGRLPFSAPYVLTGLKLNATFAVIGAIVAEFIGATSGLGFGMLSSTYNLDVPRLWAYLLVSVALGMTAYGIVWTFETLIIKSLLRMK